MIIKKRLGLLLTLILIVMLSSCSPQTTPLANTAEPSPVAQAASTLPPGLSMRITWTDYSGRGVAIQKIINGYNQTSSTPVAMIGGDEDIQAIQALLDQNAPVVFVLPYRYVKYFGAKGNLMDLTAAFQSEQEYFYPQVWALGGIKGVTYGIPWLGHAMCLLYNQTLLKQAGVDPTSITSRETFVEALTKIEQNTNARGIGLVGAEGNDISWMVNQFIYGFGGSLTNQDGTAVVINSNESRAAIEFYKDVLGSHAQSTWLTDNGVEVMNHFRNQEVAFEIQGIWGVTDIQKNGDPFEVGVLSLKDIGAYAEVGPMMLAIPAGMTSPLREQAMELIRYLISTKAQGQILLGEYSPEYDAYYPFRTPIRNDMQGDNAFAAYPEYIKFVEGFENPSIDVPVPAWQVIKNEYYGAGLHQVMSGEKSIDDFLTQIETEGNRILSDKPL